GHGAYLILAVFSPDGRRIVSASGDRTALVWDVETGRELIALIGHTSRISSAAFSPDGQRIVTASDDSTARVWDSETGRELHVLKGHTSLVFSAVFSLNGRRPQSAFCDCFDKTTPNSASIKLPSPNFSAPVNLAAVCVSQIFFGTKPKVCNNKAIS
ncbi:MAG: PD40 domain-containing protein, partial [Planctomycetes bacterium]|nr:PD40 domain-containing protein [Planctomycetota bacterium]